VAFLSCAILVQDALALDSQAQLFKIQGAAQALRGFSPVQVTVAANVTLSAASSSQDALSICDPLDPLSVQLLPASINITLKGACNHAHSVGLSAANGGLTPRNRGAQGKAGAFVHPIHYPTRTEWASFAAKMCTADIERQAITPGVIGGTFSGILRPQIAIDQASANNAPVIASAYCHRLTFTIKA
jgi:hypothetical protein